MGQYSSANTNTTVDVTNGSATVTGNGTAWSSEINVGDGFTVKNDGVIYDVASVDSDTQITLSANYRGTTETDTQYTIHRDFTTPDNIPELTNGDIETGTIMKRLARTIQTRFSAPSEISALNSANIYTSIANGLADTVDGDFFFVVNTNSYTLYSNNSGSETEEFNFSSLGELQDKVDLAQKWANENEGVVVENSEYSAKHYSIKASDWANEDEDVVVANSEYSAKHYSIKASDSASAASTSATNASNSANSASTSATNAENFATQAENVKDRLIPLIDKRKATLAADFISGDYKLYEGISSGVVDKKYSELFLHVRPSIAKGFSPRFLEESDFNEPRFTFDPGSGEQEGLMLEGRRKNSLLDNRDLSTGNWSNTATVAQDEKGIDGVANKAWTVTDDDSGVNETISQTIAVPADTNFHAASWYVKKDNDETRFPEFMMDFGNSQVVFATQLNTKTGAKNDRLTDGSGFSIVEDKGGFWKVSLILNNNGSETTLDYILSPSATTTLGTLENTATGSVIYDYGQIELNTQVPTSPVETDGSEQTYQPDNVSRDLGNEINPRGFTVFINIDSDLSGEEDGRIWDMFDSNDHENRISLQKNGTSESDLLFVVKNSGGSEREDLVITDGQTLGGKIAISISESRFRVSHNGTYLGEFTNNYLPNLDKLTLLSSIE